MVGLCKIVFIYLIIDLKNLFIVLFALTFFVFVVNTCRKHFIFEKSNDKDKKFNEEKNNKSQS